MSVSYTKEQKAQAKEAGLRLVTIDAAGMCFQGPVGQQEHILLTQYLIAFFERRAGEKKSAPVPADGKTVPQTVPGS